MRNLRVLTTYWPSRENTMPDLLDFFVCSNINTSELSLTPSFDLSSDHSPIIAVFVSRVLLKQPFPKIKYNQFKARVQNKINSRMSIETAEDVEEVTSQFMEILITSKEESVVHEKLAPSHVSLLIRNKIKEKRELKRIYQNTLHKDDKTKLNRASKNLKLYLSQYKQDYINDFMTKLKPNDHGEKNLWGVTKSIKRPAIRYPPLQGEDGGWIKSNKEKADKFAVHLEKQFTPFASTSNDQFISEFINSPIVLDTIHSQ